MAEHEKEQQRVKEYLERFVYGKLPERPEHLEGKLVTEDREFAGGSGIVRHFSLVCTMGGENFSYPVKLITPNDNEKHPIFIHLCYRDDIIDRCLPYEEIIEHGYAIMTICARNIAEIGTRKKTKIERHLCPSRRKGNSPGKFILYAWSAINAADFAYSLSFVDTSRIAVLSHGLMARSALLSMAYNKKISYIAIGGYDFGDTRSKHLPDGYYCPKYKSVASLDDGLLYYLCAPRSIMVYNTEESYFTEREKEFDYLSMLCDIYALYGLNGLDNAPFPVLPCEIKSSKIYYRYRAGSDILCRKDILSFIDYMDKKS